MEADPEPRRFEGTVRRSYAMEATSIVLVIDRYAGDIEVGDVLAVVHEGRTQRARVATVAWGSSFGADAVPLTLVVAGIDADADYAGASLTGADAPG